MSQRLTSSDCNTLYSQLLEVLFNLLRPFHIAYPYYSFTPFSDVILCISLLYAPHQGQLKASAFLCLPELFDTSL